MIIVYGSVESLPEQREQVLRMCREHVARSRQEPGCITHQAHVDIDNPNLIVFYEQWEDMAALQTHFSVSESGAFVTAVTAMAASAPQLKMFEATELPS